nr:F0F1 ATP synthase subunit alpha [bacterium]
SIMDRGAVKRELLTGITGIDLIYPIGKGQRQLIIGDKKTGKTQICLDTIVNQKDKNVLCIYVALGKTKKEVKDIYYELTKRGALSYTIIVASFHDELPTRTYLTPYVALSIAESFLAQAYDVLVCIDDLKKHADIYREISLSSKKTPGRDAYPSDIFYTHSRLLEKGCQHKNGGSITILPIVETKGGDITDYISTNIISITDGQIVLSTKNFSKGEKPAIDYGLSVSRLGGNVQDKTMKSLGSKVRLQLLSYLDVREIYELANIDEMSEELQNRLREGQKILNNLKQYKFSPKTKEQMQKDYEFIINK